MLKGACSHCGQGFMSCTCDAFHPNIGFILTEREALALLLYFEERAGYISHEFDSEVIEIIRKLREFNKDK